METTAIEIPEITVLDMAFGTTNGLPAYASIPAEFKCGGTKWNKFFTDAFYFGVKNVKYEPKPGIDTAKAMAHIKALIGSFEPKHEHKEAGVAYLLSQYFVDMTWDRA